MLPTPATSDELAHLLRASNQRATPQRVMILSILSEADNHLTADEVFQRLGPMGSALNRSTVYRTLERFRDAGIVSETDLGGGVRVFELLARTRHHHLICHHCNQMIEIDDIEVDGMRSAIRARYGFTPQVDHLAIWGVCVDCAGRN
ncbi:MAG: transcriptional repressor [Thermomicrobiales bacterium]|nr:transcriptional repressor [Thermomicrobiales bacterium]MCO5220884.1 transcriptional repressor [Thermomicrobiales bacterium]